MTETLAVNFTPNPYLQIKPYYGLFRYKDLPSKVAFYGSLRGNTVDESFASSARFNYAYEGQYYGVEGMLRFNDKYDFVGFYNELRNDKAPNTFNTGRELGVKAHIVTGDLRWVPMFKTYFNESDSAPSYYSSAEMGGNNVEGAASRLQVDFQKYKFSLAVEYYRSDVINPRRNQNDRDLVFVSVETYDVRF
jgi:hypothetical protein